MALTIKPGDHHEARRQALEYVNSLRGHPQDDQLSWLRGDYVRAEGSLVTVLQTLRELRAVVLAWPETQCRALTVREAQLLNVCRVCQGPPLPSRPGRSFVLNFGEEFAHDDCLGLGAD
jgi:hypothetical protein